MNFLWGLGSAMQGQRDYDQYLRNKALQDMQIQQRQDEIAQQKWQTQNQGQINQAVMGYLAQIPPPPQQQPAQPQPQAPQQITPEQATRTQADIAAITRELQRPKLLPEQRRILQQELAENQAKLKPPYQTLQPQQGQPQFPSIQPPPQAQQQQGGGMSMQDVARYLKAQGVTDPRVAMAVLDRLTPMLSQEAKQEAAFLRAQNAAMTNQIRELSLNQKQPLVDAQVKKTDAQTEAIPILADAARTRAANGGQGGTGGFPADAIDAMAWDKIINHRDPPRRGGAYEKVSERIAQIAKENGMSVEDLAMASADTKTKLQAKVSLERRAQNMQRAENQLDAELPVLEKAMAALDPVRVPALAKVQLSALRQAGDPRVTQLDQAAEAVFREFEGIVTGNPGTLNVQDVQNAHNSYMQAQTPEQLKAAVEGMRRIIGNAKGALKKTRSEVMDDVKRSFHPDKGGPKKISGDAEYNALPSGTMFIGPDGQTRRKP